MAEECAWRDSKERLYIKGIGQVCSRRATAMKYIIEKIDASKSLQSQRIIVSSRKHQKDALSIAKMKSILSIAGECNPFLLKFEGSEPGLFSLSYARN